MEFILHKAVGQLTERTFQGRKFLVCNVTMIVPGVLAGSKGPLLYPPEELSKDVHLWNGIPLVVWHPFAGGSAKTPEVGEWQEVGRVYNAKFDGSLKAEAWFDLELLRRMDANLDPTLRLEHRLRNGTPVEVSTGLQTTNVVAPAGSTFNGRPYDAVARNYKPDHLAVLPDVAGACSLMDGCGLLKNECNGCGGDYLMKYKLHSAIAAHGVRDFVVESAADGVVVYKRGEQTYRDEYTMEGDLPKVKNQPVEVRKLQAYYRRTTNSGDRMDKDLLVTWLTENCSQWKGSGDKELLNAMPIEKLQQLKAAALPQQTTFQQWKDSMPAEAREIWNSVEAANEEHKANIVAALTAGIEDATAKASAVAVYNSMSLKQLKPLFDAMPKQRIPVVNYGVGNRGNPHADAEPKVDKDAVLLPPTINWADKARLTPSAN